MKSTSEAYVRIYDKYFTGFMDVAGIHIAKYFGARHSERLPAILLDVCCGPGRLACFFAKRGYRVYGVDNSSAMLAHASERAAAQNATTVTFLNSDALDLELPEQVSFATATTNALCSMPDLDSLSACLARVRGSIRDTGIFVFDMNTIAGFRQTNMVTVREFADEFFVIRTIFHDEKTQVIARTSGFIRADNGTGKAEWERFDDTMIETTHQVDDILSATRQAGWRKTWAAALPDLGSPLRNPEDADRCFFVAEA